MTETSVPTAHDAIDWEEAYRRLTAAENALRTDVTRDPAEVRRILEARALALAVRPPVAAAEDYLTVVVFSLGREMYAVEGGWVGEVFRLTGWSALPGALPPVAGVTAHRGELLTLLDLRSTLGLYAAALDDLVRVILLRRGATRVGVLVDRVDGVQSIARSTLRPSPGRAGGPNEYVLGVTADLLAVLNTDALLSLFDGGGTP